MSDGIQTEPDLDYDLWPPFFYAGRRLSFEGHLCSVRWHGALPGTTGKWLGVEWDDTSRGKHDGSFKGVKVFECHYSDRAGSFIRPDRKADDERTVLQAIRDKYEFQHAGKDASTNDIVVISGKVAEEVGFDKIAQQQAQLANLRVIYIDRMVVSGLQPQHPQTRDTIRYGEQLAQTCPNIAELDIGYNIISSWAVIVRICLHLTKMSILRANGLRFAGGFSFPEPLKNVTELHLEDCKFSSSAIYSLLADAAQLPSLRSFYLSGNELSHLKPDASQTVHPLNGVTKLVLESNNFSDLSSLDAIVNQFPNVKELSFRWNQISSLGSEMNQSYPKIVSLNLSNNAIHDYSLFDNLSEVFPNLTSLRVTNNPLFERVNSDTTDDRTADQSFYLTLARIPTLQSLNYSTITMKDREEGELYYISVAEEGLKNHFAAHNESTDNLQDSVQRLHPRYLHLTKKYDRPSIVDLLGSSELISDITKKRYLPGSLGARLVTARFYIQESAQECTLRLPSSLPVTQVMSLVLRDSAIGAILQPMQFSMIFESKEFDPVGPTAEGSTRSATWGKRLTIEEKDQLWKQWGEWDADTLVAQALDDKEHAQHNDPLQHVTKSTPEYWINHGSVLVRDGRQWKRREVIIPPALKRPWGQFLDGSNDVTIRINTTRK